MNTRFEPSGRLRGEVTPPADKSISHRAALFGAMSDMPVTIKNYLDAEDTQSTLGALRALGAGVDESRPGETVVRGVGLHAALETTTGHLDVGNSGTLLRLLPGWLAGQMGSIWTLDGDESIRRRPIDRVAVPLKAMGARIEAREDRFTPMSVYGSELRGIQYTLPVATAQVKSCVLIAGMLASGHTSVTEPSQSRDHTERMLQRARVPFSRDGLTVQVSQVDELEIDEITVPADPSSAAFHAAAAAIVPGSHIVINDVGLNWTRTAFFRILSRMGAVVVGDLEDKPDGVPDVEPYGDLDVTQAPLEGTVVTAEEVPLAIDELPLVALLGCFAEGDTVVTGAAELRVKETDRLAGLIDGLNGLGANIEGTEDGFVVHGTGGLRGGVMHANTDHRMAMLGAVAGLGSKEGVEVVGMEAAAVSYPSFEDHLAGLVGGS
jgi:3-phosphoshikimate 1-carboxyvinyltransferase